MSFHPIKLIHGQRINWSEITHVRLKSRIADTQLGQKILDHIRLKSNSEGIAKLDDVLMGFPAVRKELDHLRSSQKDLRHMANPRNAGTNSENKGLIELGTSTDEEDQARTSGSVTSKTVEFMGIRLNVNWSKDNSIPVEELPNTPGIYAEIYWPGKGVRVGETGNSIKGKIKQDVRWFRKMHDGTAPENQLQRTIPIAITAKKYGASVFAYYVVSRAPELVDKGLRQECERYMFRWLEESECYVSWNHQKSWR